MLRTKLVAAALSLALVFVTYAPTTAHASSACNTMTFSKSSSGDCVRYIQTMLNAMQSEAGTWSGNGYSGGYYLVVDGKFGTNTYNNVKVFQRWVNSWHSYQMPVDGIVGPKTWGSFSAYAWHNNIHTYWGYTADSIPGSALWDWY
ncbi:exported protein of unknown function [Candidatus Saccharimonas aalborgensis]|uniref:Peptidoglycan binding-like domain-containing protein n=1 Tax=Candidatus Saccharimonas aalborgensis TaxID=1332188 RepID=R4PZ76_9BACT|nr:exported protein of unknown function [Candidatus Saccharimonas aalborgensis]MBP7775192.1 peptidoglycan-binding protein [Candidatus Saccharimonas sp.]